MILLAQNAFHCFLRYNRPRRAVVNDIDRVDVEANHRDGHFLEVWLLIFEFVRGPPEIQTGHSVGMGEVWATSCSIARLSRWSGVTWPAYLKAFLSSLSHATLIPRVLPKTHCWYCSGRWGLMLVE